MLRRKILSVLCFACSLTLAMPLQSSPLQSSICEGQAQVPQAAPVVEFRPEHNSLSVSARQQSLDAVLAAVTVASGIKFIGTSGRCEVVSIEFAHLDLNRALARLLSGRNYIVQSGVQSDGQSAGTALTRVWLLPAGLEDSLSGEQRLRQEFFRQLQATGPMRVLADGIRQIEADALPDPK